MALTQSAWTESAPAKGKFYKAVCTVIQTTAENDAYTLKTPDGLDTRKPFTLFVSTSAATDGQALPLDLWVGHGTDFALSGDGANVVATSGQKFQQITDDIGYSAASQATFAFDPDLPVAQVVTIAAIANGYKIRTPAAPYLAFNLNGGSTLAAATVTYTLVQPK